MSTIFWYGYAACPLGHFRCDDDLPPSASNCVPFNVTCDGFPDCPMGGQDEDPELCQGTSNFFCHRG